MLRPFPDNDDDFDEDNIPGFSHPSLNGAPSPLPDKGKSRAPPEQLAPPSGAGGRPQSPSVTGNIGGSSQSGGSGSGGRGGRRSVGGVQVEQRYVKQDLWKFRGKYSAM